jgi:hypothetical protein
MLLQRITRYLVQALQLAAIILASNTTSMPHMAVASFLSKSFPVHLHNRRRSRSSGSIITRPIEISNSNLYSTAFPSMGSSASRVYSSSRSSSSNNKQKNRGSSLSNSHCEFIQSRTEFKRATDSYVKAVEHFCKQKQYENHFPLSQDNATEHVQDIVQHMEKLYETGQFPIPPTIGIINALMNTLWTSKNTNDEEHLRSYGTLHTQAMVRYLESLQRPQLLPNTVTYSIVIKALSNSGGGTQAALEAETILHKMNQLHLTATACSTPAGDDNTNPTCNNINIPYVPSYHYYVKPDVISYGSVINCWINSGDIQRATSVLNQMIQLYQSDPIHNSSLRPNIQIFSALIYAWAKKASSSSLGGGKEAAVQAQTLLLQMESLYQEGLHQLKPNTQIYSMVINAWANSNSGVEAATQAENLLYQMMQKKQYYNTEPNVVTYGSVIHCWAKSRNSQAAEKAEQILKDMMERYHTTKNPNVAPNTQIFNTVINAWANHNKGSPLSSNNTIGNKAAALKALAILEDMKKMASSSSSRIDCQPDTITYNTVIKAITNSGGGAQAARESEKLLNKMWQLYYEDCRSSAKPDVITYTSVIDCWAKSGPNSEAAKRAECLLVELMDIYQRDPLQHYTLKPNTKVFSTVINSWAKVGAASKAHAILTEMELKAEEGVIPNTITYNTVIHAWAKSGRGEEACVEAEKILQKMHHLYQSGVNSQAKPDVSTYTAVIDCWAKKQTSGNHKNCENNNHAAEKAEMLLSEMIEIYLSDPIQNIGLAPNTQVFNAVINAWTKCGGIQAALKAQSILSRMEEEEQKLVISSVKPNKITYNTVINAWGKSGYGALAAIEAEKLLEKMHHLSKNGTNIEITPDAATYVAVINCWAKSGTRDAAERADRVLSEMIDMYQSDPIKYIGMTPITQVFNVVINAWAKSKSGTQAALKAQSMLLTMENMRAHSGISDIKPDTITYNTVISAWAKSNGGIDAAIEAEKFLLKMHQIHEAGNQNVKPNVKTYGSVINCWANAAGPKAVYGNESAAEKAERILDDMMRLHQSDPIKYSDLAPNTQVMNTVINAWAKTGISNKAQEMLVKMEEMNRAGIFKTKPDVVTYNTIMKALVKCGGGVEAAIESEKLLQKMQELYDEGDSSLEPNCITYTSVILGWLNSGCSYAVDKADSILKKITHIYKSNPIKYASLRPDNMPIFQTVQNARAKGLGKLS